MLEFLLVLIVTLLIFLVLISVRQHNYTTQDDISIDLTVLKQTIDDYTDLILKKKVSTLRRNHDLNPKSQVNSILSYNKKVEELITASVLEIMNLLSKRTRKNLFLRFTPESLVLFIKNVLVHKVSVGV